jgi:hypothetical protein
MLRQIAALAVLSCVSFPAAAANYSARPEAPAPTRIAARDLLWSCGPDACTGSTSNSRPVVLCEGLAKKAGHLLSFTVDGQPIASADLDRCNASARPGPATAVATAR